MHAVLQDIYDSRKVFDSNGVSYDLADSIEPREADFIDQLIHEHPHIRRTLEIGCAYGISSLAICHAVSGRSDVKHTIIDPFQYSQWRGIGVENLRRAGLHDWELIERKSEHALPSLDEKNDKKYEFILIDGWHTFDHTLIDSFYATRLLAKGGILVVDDVNFPAVRMLVNHLLTYPCYRLIGSVSRPSPMSGRQKLLRSFASLIPKSKREHFLSPYVCQLIESDENQSLMVALLKVDADQRNWDWHENFG